MSLCACQDKSQSEYKSIGQDESQSLFSLLVFSSLQSVGIFPVVASLSTLVVVFVGSIVETRT